MNAIGTLDYHLEACETCIHRDEDFMDCNDQEIDYIREVICCLNYEKGDPETEEEKAERERLERFHEIDQYQEKLFAEEPAQ